MSDIEDIDAKIQRLRTEEAADLQSISDDERAVITVFSGSTALETWLLTTPLDMYYAVNDVRDRLDEVITSHNTINSTVDGGSFD